MVDSGAKFSAVSEDVYRRTTIPMQTITSPWAFADGTVINNVIGEINVLVRYRDSVVELFRVAVIRGLQRQLILGVDWIEATKASIIGRDGVIAVFLPSEIAIHVRHQPVETVVRDKEQPVVVTERVIVTEAAKGDQEDGWATCSSSEEESSDDNTMVEEPPLQEEEFPDVDAALYRLKHSLPIQQILNTPLGTIVEDDECEFIEECLSHPFAMQVNEERKRNIEVLKAAVAASEKKRASDWIKQQENSIIGAIIVEDSEKEYNLLQQNKNVTFRLHPIKGKRIPKDGWGFVQFASPTDVGEYVCVPAARSTTPGREWVAPSGVYKVVNNFVTVPVLNLSNKSIGWSDLRGKFRCEPFVEEKSKSLEEDGVETPILSSIDSSPVPEEATELKEDLQLGACNVQKQTELEEDLQLSAEELRISNELSKAEQQSVRDVIWKHKKLFSTQLGKTDLIEHRIELLPGTQPVRCKPRPVSEEKRRIIAEKVDKMRKWGVCEQANSPWGAAVVLSLKPDLDWRFCLDFRGLNAVTVRDVYPMPNMEQVLSSLHGAKYMSSLDMEQGFWQVPIPAEHRERTAFVTPDGQFQYVTMAFGLCGSPPTFARLMDKVLGPLKWSACLCFLDDVMVFGSTLEEHNQRLDQVLTAIGKAGLTLKGKKCFFAFQQLKFLGHIIDEFGQRPDPSKLEVIEKYPNPSTQTQLRALIGLFSFYRKFVQGFAAISKPLHDLLKKDVDVRRGWTEAHEEAVTTLKGKLMSAPVLAHDDRVSPLELQVESSHSGLGAVLLILSEGLTRPLTFISRRLSDSERNYCEEQRQCLSLVWALDKLRHYVHGRLLTVKVPNGALPWLLKKRDLDGVDKYASWILTLQQYDLLNVKPLKENEQTAVKALAEAAVGEEETTVPCEATISALSKSGYTNRQLAILQRADADINHIVLSIIGLEDRLSKEEKEEYHLYRGVVYRINSGSGRKHLLLVPSILRKDLVSECHDTPVSGHQGTEKTLARLAQRYYWPGMATTVRHYVKSCIFCLTHKPRRGKLAGKLQPIRPPAKCFSLYGLDHMGPFKETKDGNRHIIAVVDFLSKFVTAKAVPDTSAAESVKFLKENVFCVFGSPNRIISDRGSAFISQLFADVMEEWRVTHTTVSAEHPEANGAIEKVNAALAMAIAGQVNLNHDDWDVYLQQAIHSINTSKHATTEISPHEMVFGDVAVLSHEKAFPQVPEEAEALCDKDRRIRRWRRTARNLILIKQEKMKAYADRFRGPDPVFNIGELVLVARRRYGVGKTKKFLPRFVGPYQIAKRIGRCSYIVEDLPANRRKQQWRRFSVHCSQLRRFVSRMETEWRPDWEDDGEAIGTDETLFDVPYTTAEPKTNISEPISLARQAGQRNALPPVQPPPLNAARNPATLIGANSVSRFGRIRRSNVRPDYVYDDSTTDGNGQPTVA